ncbi:MULTISPECIES: DUF4138 domain-containing protein [Flavobacteriaceae]|uniref:Conjugal transfer protein n=1 Tax=Maribacter cobaltidurans TaxID=1178778 RepID=A0A223V8Q5_9FLAO|nr:DUF4138 domain-containing protein [Maribacter cobaltidurans]ASV31510.1 conjugal transfer protein [Maribacter cobaltidurans]GGD96725.1 hypothetical protein GCM10011412_38590 [Maribacter cobaltidurans]|tara:strand:- start:3788 stop:4588 length:801 start_codon:yes stop_codon:yes gene_type:complete
MKTFITLLLLTFTISIQAQRSLDTIYANDQKNVALFFPKPIRQGITGASHFVFTYNREKEQYFGLLQAKQGTESNLLTVTSDGKVYSYILKYSEKLPKLNYFIDEDESIGNESPIMEIPKTGNSITASNKDRTAYFGRASEYLLRSSSETIATERKKGIRLKLQKMAYDASEVYLVIEVKNKSGIDFEIDYLNMYRANGNSKRKASYQRLQQEVIYKHKMPKSLANGQSQRFVFVLPKFVLGDNEKLMLELKELNGSRKMILETKI